MRDSDLNPYAYALITRRYWSSLAAMIKGRATEYPINPQGFPNNRSGLNQQSANGTKPDGNATPEFVESTEIPNSAQNMSQGTVPSNVPNGVYAQNPQSSAAGQPTNSANPAGTPTQSQTPGLNPNPNIVKNVAEDLRSYAPEINWDYAIIQRVNPVDLTSKLLWMSPRKAILEQDEESNLELQPGDIVTIFSQRDISVPQTERSQYVIVEGEVVRAGVYKLETNETLRSVLQRAGGLTANAYVYGSQLTRETARGDRPKSLDDMANHMEIQT